MFEREVLNIAPKYLMFFPKHAYYKTPVVCAIDGFNNSLPIYGHVLCQFTEPSMLR